MDIFTENPMIVIAIIIFVICVIIGFFGDKHFKKKKELEKSLDNTDKGNSNFNDENTSDDTIKVESSQENNNQKDVNNTTDISNNVTQPSTNETNQNNFVNAAIENSLSNIDTQTQVQNIQQNSSNSIPNNINEPNGNPVPFDGQINNDENINNMF